MERRAFIQGVAAGMLGLGFLPQIARAAADALADLRRDTGAGGSAATGPATWERIRREFLLAPGLIHLNCGSVGATPGFILDGVTKAMRELETDPVHNLYGPMGEAMETVRRHAAAFLGADEAEVTITRNTTEGMNLIATGLKLAAGDEILTTTHEHAGGMSCWQYLAEHAGAKIVQVRMPVPVRNEAEILQLLSDAITPRTRVCSLSHVTTITGLRMPLAAIAAITRPKNILLVCDGAQAPGMLPVDVHALGVDAYASSSHKWLLAPKGSGLLYIRREAQERIRPVALRAGYGVYSGSAGTRNVPHILGHGLTLDFHDAIGRERIAARCRELAGRLRTRLEAMPGLTLLSSADSALASAMLTVGLGKGKAAEIANRLLAEHRIVVKTVPATLVVQPGLAPEDYNALRFSTHIFNREADIDAAADALAKLVG